MSSTQLDRFAAAALAGLTSNRVWADAEELAAEAFRIGRAMMAERNRQAEMPDSDVMLADVLSAKIESLELPLRITKKLAGIGITRIRDLTLTTEKAVRHTGLGDESVHEIEQALHRLGLALSQT
jgi:DNA-directed RNA polymerase alpha subunit